MFSNKGKGIIALVNAIQGCQIVPHFQPIVTLHDKRIVGFEILSRWDTPTRGSIAPQVFIAHAAEAGLLDELTLCVLEQALTAAMDWPSELFLTLNVAPSQLVGSPLAQQIVETTRKLRFPLSRLQIEVTETGLLEHIDAAKETLQQLRLAGCEVILDDFGTGYSSLTWLRSLPFGKIKIDASFVRSMVIERESRKIIGAVVGLGRSLGLPVVAEGIEDEEHARILERMGCMYGQGFLYSRAVSAEHVPELLKGKAASSEPVHELSFPFLDPRGYQVAALYRSTTVSIAFLSPALILLDASDGFATRLSLSRKEILGHHILDFFPIHELVKSLNSGHTGREIELPPIEVTLPDGSADYLCLQRVYDEAHEFLGYSLIGFDITARKRAEDAMRESEAQFRYMIENSPFPFWMSDAEGRVICVNPQLQRLFGVSPEGAQNLEWMRALHEEDREKVKAERERCMAAGIVLDMHYRMYHPDGHIIWVRSWVSPLKRHDGVIIGWYGTVNEISAEYAQ